MKIIYDAEVDALSIIFHEATVTTQEVAEGIVAEYDGAGRLAGLELLDAAQHVGDDSIFDSIVLEGLTPRAVPERIAA